MLKRLELVGFKSFADKTQFDFTDGITVIVGPNGSGKSNIVDAVRWILGEQSAKSLRGGEMADVIFNGSTSRRSLGLAEVTMTLDNGRRNLATDAAEVQITRRVYRSGEGEYLINQQSTRLRDIKSLFLGTGAGSDAYCIIEQGRVEVLLQASTQDRRLIFEEAAGISRFKAKKIETLRKLEHVDQNLQRLRDIIEEVEKQLRSVKLQAAKAQRHQEYSNRLRELRVALSLEEYHQISHRLQEEMAVLERLRAAVQERSSQVEAWESETRRLEEALTQLDETTRQQESLLAHARQQIAAEETTLNHERSLSGELETDLAATRARMAELNERVAALAAAASRAGAESQAAEAEGRQQHQQVDALDSQLRAAVRRLADLQNQIQADQAAHLEQMRQAAHLQNDAVSHKAQVENLRRERERLLHKTEQAAEHLDSVNLELQQLGQVLEALQARLEDARHHLAEEHQERERLRQLQDATNQGLGNLRAQRSGLASRIEVLEGLERGQEGLGTGVREVLALLRSNIGSGESRIEDRGSRIERNDSDDENKETNAVESSCCDPQSSIFDSRSSPSTIDLGRTVLGMVADLLTVQHGYAPLIDLALADRAQRFVVREANLLERFLVGTERPFSGRVSFFPLKPFHPAGFSPEGNHQFPQHPGVVAAADQVVACDNPELAALPAQLLGNTLIVRDLATAREIAVRNSDYRFVTLQGELLETDGTLTIGAHHAATGIISRKSELRELREQVTGLESSIAEQERELAQLKDRAAALDSRAARLQEEITVLIEQEADLRTRLGQQRQRQEGLNEEVNLSRREITGIEREIASLDQAWQESKQQAEGADRQVQALQARLGQAEQEIRQVEQERQQRQQEVTAGKVALAKMEERLTSLQAKQRQIEADLDQRRQEWNQEEQRLITARNRFEESQRTMLQASAALARWYLEKETAERRTADLGSQREQQRQERQRLAERSQTARNEWQAQQEQAHARELVVNDMKHNRDSLADRLREDYQIELSELYQQGLRIEDRGLRTEDSGSQPEKESENGAIGAPRSPLDVVVVNEEIAELRRKLARLGSVNLDSLQELTELETRAANLQTHHSDLTKAKRSLEEIINAINQDSRQLFTETLVAIRTHFQELFRKLFGGGMADIILEDENDILESGIEIIARPPGKELRSISLLSGGEKTLTAVALLLAIFRSKPSPFCILDEVDAALDEANIDRFTAVLREFLDRSQFIIITHSKKTMAAADVLYGVTMQESGVSKRVAVRFEDWPEDGQPSDPEPAGAERNGHDRNGNEETPKTGEPLSTN
jgi:chromosome segregation protein